jgi:hypothetical protein
MVYQNHDGQQRHVHDHAANFNCPWKGIFKPLAFLIFHTPELRRLLPDYPQAKAEYIEWLGAGNEDAGILNLTLLLLDVCKTHDLPSLTY